MGRLMALAAPVIAVFTVVSVVATFVFGVIAAPWALVNGRPDLALAAAGVAASTAVVFAALVTYTQNHDLVTAADAQAKAARETVEEMRRQHEWAYRPWLVIKSEIVHREERGARRPVHQFVIHNAGTGPAVDIRFFAHLLDADTGRSVGAAPGHAVMSADLAALPAGAEHRFERDLTDESDPAEEYAHAKRYGALLNDEELTDSTRVRAVVAYADWFGRQYRSRDEYSLAPVDEWRAGDDVADRPVWVLA